MSQCSDCKNEAAIECCSKNMCEQCIGLHIMQISVNKHRPMPLNTKKNTEMISAIHNKIANEILELGEFKNFAIQIINDFIQSIEKEVLEISELMSQIINEKSDEIEQELRIALSHLMVKNSRNQVLSMFKHCKNVDDVKKVKLLDKSLNCSPANIAETVKRSINFSISLENNDNNPQDFEENSITEKIEPENVEIPKSRSPQSSDPEKIQRRNSGIVIQRSERLRSQNFPKPQYPNIYNFIPFTKKIVFYNPVDEILSELLIDTHIFPPKAAWSVTEDGKVIMTGGFDEFAKKDSFLYSSYEKKTERVPKMVSPKYNHAQISIGNFVYVIGGMGAGPLKTCERYNLHRREWTSFASLVVARECPAACYCGGKIYVIGGIGIESIEVTKTSQPKFELIAVRLPGPGRCFSFAYDHQVYILHRHKILTLSLPAMVLKENGYFDENEVWSSCEPIVRAGDVNWVCNNEFLQYHMASQLITHID